MPSNETHAFALVHKPELDGQLDAMDFEDHVKLHFEDGSFVFFEYAFAREEGKFLVVYTEHCGYHVFYNDGFAENMPLSWGVLPERFKIYGEDEEDDDDEPE